MGVLEKVRDRVETMRRFQGRRGMFSIQSARQEWENAFFFFFLIKKQEIELAIQIHIFSLLCNLHYFFFNPILIPRKQKAHVVIHWAIYNLTFTVNKTVVIIILFLLFCFFLLLLFTTSSQKHQINQQTINNSRDYSVMYYCYFFNLHTFIPSEYADTIMCKPSVSQKVVNTVAV